MSETKTEDILEVIIKTPSSSGLCKYGIYLQVNGRFQSYGNADTLWGARYKGRKLAREYRRRGTQVVESFYA